MTEPLEEVKVAFLVANEGIEQVELIEPWQAVEEAGGVPKLVAPKPGTAQAMNHLDKADTFLVASTTAEASAEEYDALVLPGGVANPDQLRMDEAAVAFVQAMFKAGKPAAAICHGPWTLVEAGLTKDRTLTSWPSLQTDIRNAGGHWVDEEVFTCEGGPNILITSRNPDDLPAFCKTAVHVFSRARQDRELMADTHDEPTLDDVMDPEEPSSPDRREHAKAPPRPNEAELDEKVALEREEVGLDPDEG